MSVPIEKLGAACFLENLGLYVNRQTEPEKYNLYNGLRAMAEAIESLTQVVYKIEKQLNSLNHKLENLP